MEDSSSCERCTLVRSIADDDVLCLNGTSRINSMDSYSPLMKPDRGGQSGCLHGRDMTIKCRGTPPKSILSTSASETVDPSSGIGCFKAAEEVRSNVTKSLGVVGPGNCADRWYTRVMIYQH